MKPVMAVRCAANYRRVGSFGWTEAAVQEQVSQVEIDHRACESEKWERVVVVPYLDDLVLQGNLKTVECRKVMRAVNRLNSHVDQMRGTSTRVHQIFLNHLTDVTVLSIGRARKATHIFKFAYSKNLNRPSGRFNYSSSYGSPYILPF